MNHPIIFSIIAAYFIVGLMLSFRKWEEYWRWKTDASSVRVFFAMLLVILVGPLIELYWAVRTFIDV